MIVTWFIVELCWLPWSCRYVEVLFMPFLFVFTIFNSERSGWSWVIFQVLICGNERHASMCYSHIKPVTYTAKGPEGCCIPTTWIKELFLLIRQIHRSSHNVAVTEHACVWFPQIVMTLYTHHRRNELLTEVSSVIYSRLGLLFFVTVVTCYKL